MTCRNHLLIPFEWQRSCPAGGTTLSLVCYTTNWNNPPAYEAVSYAWGDANAKADVLCNGEIIEVTQSLYIALS